MGGDDGAPGRYYSGLLLACLLFFFPLSSQDVSMERVCWAGRFGVFFLFFLIWLLEMLVDRAFGLPFLSLVLARCSGLGESPDVG